MKHVSVFVSLAALLVATACNGTRQEATGGEPVEARPPFHPNVVRVAAVNTTISTGLLPSLVADFEATSGYTVELLGADTVDEGKKGRGKSLFGHARAGEVDLLIAHYGKAELAPFVREGLGEFPRLVFANQAALIGPIGDPAGIAGMTDGAAAFAKIAASGAPYVENNLAGLRYLSDVLWHAAGRPEKGDWYIESEAHKAKAVREADEKGAYVLFGTHPFLHHSGKHGVDLTMHVIADPAFQRTMATVVVDSESVPGVNSEGARAFQRYLVSAKVQAAIRAYRAPGVEHQLWWPMARSNNPAELVAPAG